MTKIGLCLCLSLLAPGLVWADGPATPPATSTAAPAEKFETQMDLNIRSGKEWQKADDALNAVYKALMAKLDEEGQKKLQAAQRAWIKFRDAECESQADDYRGGSIMPLIRNGCARDLTEARTKDLQVRLKELESH